MKQTTRLAMMFLLVSTGCDNAPLSAPGGSPDAMGGEPMMGGHAMGGDMPIGGVMDAAPDAAFGGQVDQGFDMTVDRDVGVEPGGVQCRIPGRDGETPAVVPDYGRATAVFDGAAVHLIWYEASDGEDADDAGVYRCVMGPDGLFEGEAMPIRDLEGSQDRPEGGVEGVVSERIRGIPWVAYGGADTPIRVFQAHTPAETLIRLDGEDGWPHLVGPPVMAALGRDVVVFGRTPNTDDGPGQPAWIRLSWDLSMVGELSIFPGMTLPQFDDVVPVRGGLLARAGAVGQCVFLGGDRAEPLSNLDCRAGPGGLLTDGQTPLLWTQLDLEERRSIMNQTVYQCSQRVAIWNAYAFEESFNVVNLEQTALLGLPRYNGLKPIIGRRRTPLPSSEGGVGETSFNLVAYGQWWSSGVNAQWMPDDDLDAAPCGEDIESAWPYPTTRAVAAFQPLATGCPQEEGCVLDTLNAVLFEFTADGPRLRYLPLVERTPGPPLSGLAVEAGCRPSPEICDGLDNDCDGRIDDGTCCIEDAPVLSVDFPEILPDGMPPTGPVRQWMITADENAREYWLFYRSEIPEAAEGAPEEAPGDLVWDGFYLPETQGEPEPSRQPTAFWRFEDTPRMHFAYFGDGVFVTPAGGRVATLMRDTEGVLHLVWHASKTVKDPVALPPACQDYLALGVMRVNGNRESIFLACRDRLVRYYYSPLRLDLTYYWGDECPEEGGCDATREALGLVESGEIDWATITQHPLASDPLSDNTAIKWDNEFFLMVGYTDPTSDAPALASYQVSYRDDERCDDVRFDPCIDHCGAQYESDYCGRDPDQIFAPDIRPGWIGNDAELEASWRACGADAVAVKTTCCEALFDRILRETDSVAEERREALVAQCVQNPRSSIPAWVNQAQGAGETDYVIDGWLPCFDQMQSEKVDCCFALDGSQLACHQPSDLIVPALLDRYASADPAANYPHPFWVAPSRLRMQRAVRSRAPDVMGDRAVLAPRYELARQGPRDADGVPEVDWQPVFYGTETPDAVQFAPMARRIVAAERGDGETRFWFLSLEADDDTLALWSMRPTYRADLPLHRIDRPEAAGQPSWAFVEGPNFVNRSQYRPDLGDLGVFDNTLVEFRPRHRLVGGPVGEQGLTEGDLVLNGQSIRATGPDDDASPGADENGASAIAVAAAINETADLRIVARPGVTRLHGDPIAGGEVPGVLSFQLNAETVRIPSGEAGPGEAGVVLEGDLNDALENAINDVWPQTGVVAAKTTETVDGVLTTRLVLEAEDGRNIVLAVRPEVSAITGLRTGTTRTSIVLDHDAPIVIGGANALAAGLVNGESEVDPSRWRITARRVFCGAKN